MHYLIRSNKASQFDRRLSARIHPSFHPSPGHRFSIHKSSVISIQPGSREMGEEEGTNCEAKEAGLGLGLGAVSYGHWVLLRPAEGSLRPPTRYKHAAEVVQDKLYVVGGGRNGRYLSDVQPLLAIDVWEHAYYLDYENRRAEYVSAFLEKLVSWEMVESKLRKAVVRAIERDSNTSTKQLRKQLRR